MPGFIALLLFGSALLYASVGHGGASGYLAVMALFGLPPESMKPTALVLNVLVSSIALFQFWRAGSFSWPLFWPFAIASAPMAFIGGAIPPVGFYKPVVGAVLLFYAWRLLQKSGKKATSEAKRVPLWLALVAGAGIGLLSGLTGVGGGIFLSPLILMAGWADPRRTAGVSSAFILVNSIAGLLGHLSNLAALPAALPLWIVAAILGGWLGASWGSQKLAGPAITRLLGAVLAIAGTKMLVGV